MVRAKFRVQNITKSCEWGSLQHSMDVVTLVAVSDEANKGWSKWTPAGKLEMQINNPEALNQFKLGQTYFLDFSEAPQAEKDEK